MHLFSFPSFASALGLLSLVLPDIAAALPVDDSLAHRANHQRFPYQNAKLQIAARVEDLLSRMTYLDKLAQTRASPYGLSTNSTYNLSEIVEFNAPYGLGSICK